jgi:mono/diheme cytochrome c family protein
MRVRAGIERPQTRTEDYRRWMSAALAACLAVAALAGCDVERRKSDVELGLRPQQAAGRKIYDNYCDRCHRPYSTKGRKGPGLKGVFQRQYLPLSGLPANDDRVGEIIRYGRHEMPGYSQTLDAQGLQDLMAYLHTL